MAGPSDWMTRSRWCSARSRLLLGRRRPELAAVQVRAEEVHVPAGVLVRHPSPVAGRDDRRAGVAVVRAVGREHLVAAGVQARHADGVLVGVRAAVGEEHLARSRRAALRDDALGGLAAREVGGGRARSVASAPACSWIAVDDGRMLVADVDVDELAREVEDRGCRRGPTPSRPSRRRSRGGRGSPGPTRSGTRDSRSSDFAARRGLRSLIVAVRCSGRHGVCWRAATARSGAAASDEPRRPHRLRRGATGRPR